MAKIIIAGDAAVVKSARTLDEIKLIEKYAPKALVLYTEDEDGKKQPVFRCAVSKAGSISNAGVAFGGAARDGSGLATVTVKIPEWVTDAKAWVADEFGSAVVQLNKLEATFDDVLAQIAADKAAVEANIEVL